MDGEIGVSRVKTNQEISICKVIDVWNTLRQVTTVSMDVDDRFEYVMGAIQLAFVASRPITHAIIVMICFYISVLTRRTFHA
jgi:hypothetical protein